MQEGAVAVLDALGFKGIWRGAKTPKRIFDRLGRIRDRAARLIDDKKKGTIALAAFSDSIILGSQSALDGAVPSTWNAYVRVRNLMVIAAEIMQEAALDERWPLAYRGTIAFGGFARQGEYWLGPAIDEAAASERLAEAAVIWCCPSAKSALDRGLNQGGEDSAGARLTRESAALSRVVLWDYDVPLKGGQRFQTHVVNPFGSDSDLDSRKIYDQILAAFDRSANDLSVGIKRQNTKRFLTAARDWNAKRPERVRLREERFDSVEDR